jgi:hypothetical protein
MLMYYTGIGMLFFIQYSIGWNADLTIFYREWKVNLHNPREQNASLHILYGVEC